MAKGTSKRVATVSRKTAETDISITLAIDGTGQSKIGTGVGFFDHMLTLFAKHGLFDLTVRAKGDVDVDYHHTVEDVGLVLGQAFSNALGANLHVDLICGDEPHHIAEAIFKGLGRALDAATQIEPRAADL